MQLLGSLLVFTHRPLQAVGVVDGQLDAHANEVPSLWLAQRAASPPHALSQSPQLVADEGSRHPPSHVRKPASQPPFGPPSADGPSSTSSASGEDASTPGASIPASGDASVPGGTLPSHPSAGQSAVEYAPSPEIAAHAPRAPANATAPATPSSNRMLLYWFEAGLSIKVCEKYCGVLRALAPPSAIRAQAAHLAHEALSAHRRTSRAPQLMTPSRARPPAEIHRGQREGWLRAAILGADDGIVSTASLMIGVAAASASNGAVFLAGAAGLVAGAMSMAAGEYVSVSSQRDAQEADIATEKAELAANPHGELRELATIYEKRGLDADLARRVAAQLTAHDQLAAHMRDELGLSEKTRARPVQA